MALYPADNKGFTVETRHVLPAHLLVRIESFSLVVENKIQHFESKVFAAGDYKWRLIICHDGHKSENADDHISVYISVAEASSLSMHWEVNAFFNIFLYNHISDNYLCYRGKLKQFNAMNPKWGFPRLISTKMLREPSNGYLVDDKCVFGAEVFVIKNQRVTECVSLWEPKVANTHKLAWTITDFSKLEGVWSKVFNAGYYGWKIILYPNGVRDSSAVSIFLECVSAKSFAPHQTLRVEFCFRIKDNLHHCHHSKNFCHFYTSSGGQWGLENFIAIADMRDPSRGFVVDDSFVLETEIFVDVDASKF